MKKLLIIVLLSVFAVNIFAGHKRFDGYIINMQNERIEGQIKIKGLIAAQVKVTFIEKGKRSVYKPMDILGYGYQYFGKNEFGNNAYNWKHYKCKKAISSAPSMFISKTVFMEVIEAGNVTVYDYYAEKRNDIENPYNRYCYLEREGSDEWTEVTEENYISVASVFFKDNTELVSKIGMVNHHFRHLWKVVRLHNDWIEKQDETMGIYTESKPF